LSAADMQQLEAVGMRYCQPVIRHGKAHTAASEWKEKGTETAV
jgi:hypothetical protein